MNNIRENAGNGQKKTEKCAAAFKTICEIF